MKLLSASWSFFSDAVNNELSTIYWVFNPPVNLNNKLNNFKWIIYSIYDLLPLHFEIGVNVNEPAFTIKFVYFLKHDKM